MSEDKERIRVTRLKVCAEMKRSSVIAQIRATHAMALRVSDEKDLAPELLILVDDLDALWVQFVSKDDNILEYLISLDKSEEYSVDMVSEVRALISASKAVATKLVATRVEAIDLSHINDNLNLTDPRHRPLVSNVCHKWPQPFSRLPEIPLPHFEGDFRYWPTFRDRFLALVDGRPNLSDIDKMYYLIGCLKGPEADAVRGIPVSGDNYKLIWSTLSTRFYRPRLVATSLVDNLLHASSFSQESLHNLNKFLCVFRESISLLDALDIADMGSFILFSVAFRCLPVATRKQFESATTSNFPSIAELLKFVQTRVGILEIVGDPRKNNAPSAPSKIVNSPGQSRKGGEWSWKPEGSRPTSLVTSTAVTPSLCYTGSHSLTSCDRFKAWAVDERARWTREKQLCFLCFRLSHWAPKCTSKVRCQHCSRKHHSLLHPPAGNSRGSGDATQSDVVLCASTPSPKLCTPTSVMLGTALVHVRDRMGSWHTLRALIDCASQISVITATCADWLGHRRTQLNLLHGKVDSFQFLTCLHVSNVII